MAFPTTEILDNFNRANEGPPPSASWTNVYNGLKVSSNQCVGNTASDNISDWNVSTFGPDSECHAKIPVFPSAGTGIGLGCRLTTHGSSTQDGYWIIFSYYNTLILGREDNGSFTQLGANISRTINEGDSIGIEVIGTSNNIKAYHKPSGGSWSSSLATRSDGTYTAAGYIGADNAHTSGAIDDFGGGTAGGTVYQEDLTSLAISASSILDVQNFIQVLDSAIQSQSSLTDLQNYLQILDSLIQSQSALEDLQTYKETLESLIQSVSSESDAKAIVEDLQTTIASISAVTAIQNYVHALDSAAQSATSLSDVQNYIDIVTSTAQSISSIADFKTYTEILDSIVTSVSTISDTIILAEALETQIQSEATLADIQHYFETLLTTIVSEASVTEVLTGQFVEELLSLIISEAGVFEAYQKPGMVETTSPFYLASKKEFQFGKTIGVFKTGESVPQFIIQKRYGATA